MRAAEVQIITVAIGLDTEVGKWEGRVHFLSLFTTRGRTMCDFTSYNRTPFLLCVFSKLCTVCYCYISPFFFLFYFSLFQSETINCSGRTSCVTSFLCEKHKNW